MIDLSLQQKSFINYNKQRLDDLAKKLSVYTQGKEYPIYMLLDYRFLYAYTELFAKNILDTNNYSLYAESLLWDLEDAHNNKIFDVMKNKLALTWEHLKNKYNITPDDFINESLNSFLIAINNFFKGLINKIGLIGVFFFALIIIMVLKNDKN